MSPLALVVVWFACSVPAAIGVGAMLSGKPRTQRPVRGAAPAPVVVLATRR